MSLFLSRLHAPSIDYFYSQTVERSIGRVRTCRRCCCSFANRLKALGFNYRNCSLAILISNGEKDGEGSNSFPFSTVSSFHSCFLTLWQMQGGSQFLIHFHRESRIEDREGKKRKIRLTPCSRPVQ